jgi:AcrR family transcriptional regulator
MCQDETCGRTARTRRRTDALSRQRIIAAAAEILDSGGEDALTVRSLSTYLATGSGAIYWHVGNMAELLCAVTEDVVARAIASVADVARPREAIRATALALFDAVAKHRWAGTQLSRKPGDPAVLLIFESLGGNLVDLGVAEEAQFGCASALLHYVLEDRTAHPPAMAGGTLTPGTRRLDYQSTPALVTRESWWRGRRARVPGPGRNRV